MINSYGQDIDTMWESDTARAWEDLNDIPEEEEEEEEDIPAGFYVAMYDLERAFSDICKAAATLHSASKSVEDLPEDARIESLAMDAEDLADCIDKMRRSMSLKAVLGA